MDKLFADHTWWQTNGGKFRFNPNLYAVSLIYGSHIHVDCSYYAGWQSLSLPSGNVAGTGMGIREIDVITGIIGGIIQGIV